MPLCLYTDAASTKNFATVFGEQLFMHTWPEDFGSFHIKILDLFPIVFAVEIWGRTMTNRGIIFCQIMWLMFLSQTKCHQRILS